MKIKYLLVVFLLSVVVNAQNFERVEITPTRTEYVQLEVGPGDLLWAGTWGEGIFQSADKGKNFTELNNGLTNLYITDISFKDGVLLAATRGGVFKSLNNGQNWAKTGTLPSTIITSISIDDENIYYVSFKGKGVYKTTNGGNTWFESNNGIFYQDVMTVFVTKAENTVLASTKGRGIFRTSDGGESWERSNSGNDSFYSTEFKYDGDDKLWVSTLDSGLFFSEDHGVVWLPTNKNEIFDANINCFELYLRDSDQAYYPIIGTKNWGVRYFDAIFSDQRFQSSNNNKNGILDMVTFSDQSILASSVFQGLKISNDKGVTWDQVGSFSNLTQKIILDSKDSTVFMLREDGLYRSTNNAETFTELTDNSTISEMSFNNNDFFYYDPVTLYYSTDNGDNFNSAIKIGDFSGLPDATDHEKVAQILTLDIHNNTIAASLLCNYQYTGSSDEPPPPPEPIATFQISTNLGMTWQETSSNSFSYLEIQRDLDFYAVDESNIVWKSTDNGANWNSTATISALVTDITSFGSSRVYLSTRDGLYYSNNGNDFQREDLGIDTKPFEGLKPKPYITDLDVISEFEMYAVANNNSGLYRTTDGGVSWDSLSYGLPNGNSNAVTRLDNGKVVYGNTGLHYFYEQESIDSPEQLTPANGTGGIALDNSEPNGATPLILSWKSVAKADMYQIEVDDSKVFNGSAINLVSDITSHTSTQVLNTNSTYYWRVRTRINDTWSKWSPNWTFSTVIDSPMLVTPENGETGVPTIASLSWTEVDGASTYEVEISEDFDFSSTYFHQNGIDETTISSNTLSPLSVYWWRARAFSDISVSAWSISNSFTTITGVPSLVYPEDNSGEIPTAITFLFNEVDQSEVYNIQVSLLEDFSDPTQVIVDDRIEADTTYDYDLLAANTQYFWRVRSGINLDVDGSKIVKFGSWSEANRFSTGLRAPEINLPKNNAVDIIPVDVEFSWFSITEATGYDFRLATDLQMSSFITEETNEKTSFINQDTIDYYTEFWWQVRAKNDDGEGTWSSPSKFRTIMEGPEIKFPICENTEIPTTTNLVWVQVKGAESYEVELSTDEGFINVIQNPNDISNDRVQIEGLEGSNSYFWRVRGFNAESIGEWSEVCSFSTITSVDDKIISELDLSLYPSPSKDIVNIDFFMVHSKKINIEIFNLNGKRVDLVLSDYLIKGAQNIKFDVSNFPVGAYYIKVQAGENSFSQLLNVVK